jgi:probable nitrogen fixation protein FixT
MKVSEVTGKPIPDSLAKERGRFVDMLTDSHTWLHGKKISLYGDPDFVFGMTKFLTELGIEPLHVLCNNGSKKWTKAMEKMLAETPYGKNTQLFAGADLWHFRSLVLTEKPDFMIGNSYAKFIQRDTLHKGKEFEVPLIRIGFPIFDRHHLHRSTTLGYEGAMQMLTTITNAVLERLDEETRGMGTTDYNHDLVPYIWLAHNGSSRASNVKEVAMANIMIQRGSKTEYVFYLPKRDLEDDIISMEFNTPEKWGGEIKLNNGGTYYIEPQPAPARLPISLRAKRLDAAE